MSDKTALTEPEPSYRPPMRRSGLGIFYALLMTVAAGGLGYLAWTYRQRTSAANAELGTTKTSLEQCAAQKEEHERASGKWEGDRKKCDKLDADLKKLQKNLKATRSELDALLAQREEADKRIAAFKELTAQLQKMIDSGQLKVIIRKGRMVVELPAQVLFPSGSAELSKPGQMALLEVGGILKKMTDRSFMVAGHTDSEKVSGKFRNNWELSTARALTVVEFLIEAGMKPQNLVAAGYGEFDPIATNASEAGRKQNRRIEIVLLPNVHELPHFPPELTGEPPVEGSAKPNVDAGR